MNISKNQDTFVSAALYITSHVLTPEAISTALGIKPTRTELKGNLHVDPSLLSGLSEDERLVMQELPNRTPAHYFIFEVSHRIVKSAHDSSGQMLETLLEELIGRIEGVAGQLEQLRNAVTASLMCSYGTYHKPEWFILSNSLMERIARLRLPLTVLLAPLEGDTSDGT